MADAQTLFIHEGQRERNSSSCSSVAPPLPVLNAAYWRVNVYTFKHQL